MEVKPDIFLFNSLFILGLLSSPDYKLRFSYLLFLDYNMKEILFLFILQVRAQARKYPKVTVLKRYYLVYDIMIVSE